MKRLGLIILLVNSAFGFGVAVSEESNVNQVLNSLHEYASKANGEKYFALFSPNAVFLGTDGGERWTLKDFQSFAKPYFDKGKGWTYEMKSRNIFLSDDKKLAWFDEELINASYGDCRGSGVLTNRNGKWKIAQYNLTIPIPNEITLDVVKLIQKSNAKPTPTP